MRYKKSQELYIFFFYILTPFGVYKTTLDDFKTGTRLPSDESTIVSVRLSPFYRRVTLVCKPFQTLQDVFMMSLLLFTAGTEGRLTKEDAED